MRPWTIDADDIQVADDLDKSLLHRTNWIDEFLAQGRDEKFIVTGTKGFGKTLLLKAKRIAYQQSKSTICLPENSLLDKPIGDKIFSSEMIELYGRSSDNWRKVWLISIAVTVLKHLDQLDGVTMNPRLSELAGDTHLRSVIDHFVSVLDFPRSELFRSGIETDSQLVPRLRIVNTPIAVFVDSIDEYFNKHVINTNMRSSDAGELSSSIWHLSQTALVETAYQLRRVNHHIKVFATIRKEAFAKLDDATPMVQQYRGSTIDISYTPASLREIFLNNIRKEKEHNLIARAKLAVDPIEAFLGLTRVTHAATGRREKPLDFILRHTLQRPRDLMTIGQKLSQIAPGERNEEAIKRAVHKGATEIAREYLNEISPYVGIELESVFTLIHSNVLRREALDRIMAEHRDTRGDRETQTADREGQVFSMLFQAGLLGCVDTDLVSTQRIQHFLRPGDRTFDPDEPLPQSTHYLVHPVLGELIQRSNSRYAGNMDRINIIGDGLSWHDGGGSEALFVLRGDIMRFSDMMLRSEIDHAVQRRLRQAVEQHAETCCHHEISAGDSITLVHKDANAIIKVIRRIMEDLFEEQGHPVLRVAIDYGQVLRSPDDSAGSTMSGAPFRIAARLEPHVQPNEIWVTESFKAALERDATRYEAVEVRAPDPGNDAWQGSWLNVKKPASAEQDLWIRPYRIEDRSLRT